MSSVIGRMPGGFTANIHTPQATPGPVAGKAPAAARAAEISSFAPGSGVDRRFSVKFLGGIDQRMKLAGVPTELASALSQRFASMSRSELDREGRVVDGILTSTQPSAGLEVYEHQARLERSSGQPVSKLGSGLGALTVSLAAGHGDATKATAAAKAGLEALTTSPRARELQALLARAGQSAAPSSKNDAQAERAALLLAAGTQAERLQSPKSADAALTELTTLAEQLRGGTRGEALASLQQSLSGAQRPVATNAAEGLKRDEAALGPGGLRPDEGLLGGVGAELLGEGPGRLEGPGGLEGMKDLFGSGTEGLIPDRGPDLTAGLGGLLDGRGRDRGTDGLPDPFAGQGKTPLGENAGRGPDPRVGYHVDSNTMVFRATMLSHARDQQLGAPELEGEQLKQLGRMASATITGDSLPSALKRIAIAEQTGCEEDPVDRAMVDAAARQLAAEKDAAAASGTSTSETDDGTPGDGTQQTPDPQRGDDSIGGSPRQQAEFKAMVAAMTSRQHARPARTAEWAMGDREDPGHTKDMAVAAALKEKVGDFGDRQSPWILTDEADADLGLPEPEIEEVDMLGGDTRDPDAPRTNGPKPKPE